MFQALGFKSLFAPIVAVLAMVLVPPAAAAPVYNVVPLGLDDLEHTRNDGYKFSQALNMNEAGHVHGNSKRYNGGSSQLGQDAWLYDGETTIDIGLTGTEHTSSSGRKYSVSQQLNEAGQVIGFSYRYNGGADLGHSAWLYDGATTIDIGLTGPEHTRNDGYKSSYSFELNQAGQVRGLSNRYNGGSADLGLSAWLYDGATTIDIGLTGAEHTRNDGYQYNFAGYQDQLNEVGQVIGFSYRYNGGSTQLGQDAWFYDPVLDQTFVLQLSTRSDGYAFSSANYLGEDGLTLGTYTLFDALNQNLGQHLSYFTDADGLHVLGSLVDGGLPANGWDSLASAIRANGLGQILGHGKLTSQSAGQMPYLLTPIPEPSSLLLLSIAGAGLLWPRRAPLIPNSLGENGCDLGLQRRQVLADYVPNLRFIDQVVPVNKHIAKRNDLLVFADLCSGYRIDLCQSPHRLADDFEAAFNRLSYQSIAAIVVESFVLGSLPYECGRVANVLEQFWALSLHKAACACDSPRV